MIKLEELTKQMPNYVSVATQTSFLAVTNDLVGIVSYLVDSLNYQVYFAGSSSESDATGEIVKFCTALLTLLMMNLCVETYSFEICCCFIFPPEAIFLPDLMYSEVYWRPKRE